MCHGVACGHDCVGTEDKSDGWTSDRTYSGWDQVSLRLQVGLDLSLAKESLPPQSVSIRMIGTKHTFPDVLCTRFETLQFRSKRRTMDRRVIGRPPSGEWLTVDHIEPLLREVPADASFFPAGQTNAAECRARGAIQRCRSLVRKNKFLGLKNPYTGNSLNVMFRFFFGLLGNF